MTNNIKGPQDMTQQPPSDEVVEYLKSCSRSTTIGEALEKIRAINAEKESRSLLGRLEALDDLIHELVGARNYDEEPRASLRQIIHDIKSGTLVDNGIQAERDRCAAILLSSSDIPSEKFNVTGIGVLKNAAGDTEFLSRRAVNEMLNMRLLQIKTGSMP